MSRFASPYSTLTSNNRSAIKRFSHGRRVEVALSLVTALPGENILDIGTGDGAFPLALVHLRPMVCVVAQEPLPHMLEQARAMCVGERNITVTQAIPDLSFDWVTCFEVLEHLPPATIDRLLTQIHDALQPHGRVVISVPLEVGLPGLIKNVVRHALKQSHPSTLSDKLRAALGYPVRRNFPNGYCGSHVGFDYRTLPSAFKNAGLKIVQVLYSPFPQMRFVLNSQVFWVLCKDVK
jgi:SAM-dependent methyltransferase